MRKGENPPPSIPRPPAPPSPPPPSSMRLALTEDSIRRIVREEIALWLANLPKSPFP